MVDAVQSTRVGPRAPLRREGIEKLTGATRFTSDLRVPGAWHGATVRSDEAHARLLGIELDAAFDCSQVVVVTAADVPGRNVIDGDVLDQPALAEDEILHAAQAVALVAAPSPELAEAARRAIRLRTEPLPAVFDPETAPACKTFTIATGDLETGFAAADLVFEGEYRTGHQEHLYLEPQGMIAIPRDDGAIEVHGSFQNPYYVHGALVLALGLAPDEAVVVHEDTGGGFGGKEDFPSLVAVHAALLARKAGRPVRLVYGRQEDLAASTKRHPSIVRHRTGVTREGLLVAQDIEVILDAGAYTTVSRHVLARAGVHATGPYRCPNVRIRARAGLTNTPPNGAFRGFGGPQTEFAAETQLSRIAEALGMSPLEIRRRNAYRDGDRTATGQLLCDHVGVREVLEAAVGTAGLDRAEPRASTLNGSTATGVGIAVGWHGSGFTGSGEAQLVSTGSVEITGAGQILGLCSSTEMGQGSRTVLAQVVAEALGVEPEDVEIVRADTSRVPDTGPTVASRSTMVAGAVLANAAARLRGEVETATGRPFAIAYQPYVREHGALRASERFRGAPGASWDEERCLGDAYPAYSWSAVVATVDVDRDTGEVSVRSIIHAVDAGRIVNPVLAEGQVEGGTLQAIGYATMEDVQLEGGRYRNDRLSTYLVPTALDAPPITALLVANPLGLVPHGAKGLGELPMIAPAPAIVAAIRQAIGVWITSLPATPEKILAALAAREAEVAE